MITFHEAPVDDPRAQRMLTEYFAERVATFPQQSGPYVRPSLTPQQFVLPDGVFLLVLDARTRSDAGAAAIGCGGIRRLDVGTSESTPGATRFEVKHLWVQPDRRGGGLGRLLLTELERRAYELGATELVLDTNRSLEAAGALYRRSGYSTIAAYNDNPNATDWYLKQVRPQAQTG